MPDLSETLPRASEAFKRLNPGLFASTGPQKAERALPYAPPSPSQRKPAKRAGKPANRGAASSAQPEQTVRDASMEPHEREALYPGRVSVRVISYRRRLLDPDNLCPKWFLDACRYSKLIRDDRPQDIAFSVAQEKVRTKAEERTEIILTPLP